MTKRELKASLFKLIGDLEKYDDDQEMSIIMYDNCGGYTCNWDAEYEITDGIDGCTYVEFK